MNNNKKPETSTLYSINEIIAIKRADHPKRNKWLFVAQMIGLLSWPLMRHVIVPSIIKYFKNLIAEQDGSLYYKKRLKQ